MFERVGAKKTEKGVAVFMRAYGILMQDSGSRMTSMPDAVGG
jgi:hypothetical protein